MKISQISIFLIIFLFSCTNSETGINNPHFDEQYRILEIDFESAPDESLMQIIRYCNIRKEGYGVLLNIEKVFTKKKLKPITGSFRKRDINAVHIFNIDGDSIPGNIRAAIEGASFTWLLTKKEGHFPFCGQLKAALGKSIKAGGIIVISSGKNTEDIKKCIED